MDTLTSTTRIAQLAQKVLSRDSIDHDDAIELLELKGDQRYDLFYWANRIRLEFLGPEISLCGIVSARTGSCSEDCRFCCQSAHYNTNIQSQTAPTQQIVRACNQAIDDGAHCFGIVSSGRSVSDDNIKQLAPAITKITSDNRINCSASLGCITEKQAQNLYDLGLRSYHHNLETSRRFFPQIVSTHNYDQRIATIEAAKRAGLKICSGGIIGLGETLDDRVDLAITLRELQVDSVPINFLMPIEGTPLAKNEVIRPLTALQTIAMFRFVLPDRQIKIAGGREQCLGDLQSWMFYAGASGTMIGNYLTAPGRSQQADLKMFADLEMPIKSYPDN